MSREWQVVEREDQKLIHVIPWDDLQPHVEEVACLCEPELEVTDEFSDLLIHNSYDKRELN